MTRNETGRAWFELYLFVERLRTPDLHYDAGPTSLEAPRAELPRRPRFVDQGDLIEGLIKSPTRKRP